MTEDAKLEPFVARGGVAELFRTVHLHPEILIEGPAGTGKSRGVAQLCDILATNNPGIRILFLRQTRSSLTDSVMVTFDTAVLWPGHPALTPYRAPEHRSRYIYPNGSIIVLGGLDKPERTFSTEYDVIFVEEAVEISLDAWEKLIRANRNNKLHFQVMIAATNPGRSGHWLNKRADMWVAPYGGCVRCSSYELVLHSDQEEPHTFRCLDCEEVSPGERKMHRILSRHRDNPAYYDAEKGEWTPKGRRYLRRLAGMSGARRARLYEGKWVAEEGLVFPTYDPSVHLVNAEFETDRYGKRFRGPLGQQYLRLTGPHPTLTESQIELTWFFGSIDWGMRNPGSLSIWGVDTEDRMWRLAQVYRTKRDVDWWAERAKEFHEEFRLSAIVADPSRNDLISVFNDRLGSYGGRDVKRICVGGNNDWDASIQTLNWAFTGTHPENITPESELHPTDLDPRIFFRNNALRYGRDQDLDDQGKPICTEDEIEGLTWRETKDGQEEKDEPDPSCPRHGIDETRYASLYHWKRDMTPKAPQPLSRKGTLGALLDHDAVHRRKARRRPWYEQ